METSGDAEGQLCMMGEVLLCSFRSGVNAAEGNSDDLEEPCKTPVAIQKRGTVDISQHIHVTKRNLTYSALAKNSALE